MIQSCLAVSLARLTNLSTTWTVRPLTQLTRPPTHTPTLVETFDTLEHGVDTLDFNENYVPSFVPPPLVCAREIQSMYWTQ